MQNMKESLAQGGSDNSDGEDGEDEEEESQPQDVGVPPGFDAEDTAHRYRTIPDGRDVFEFASVLLLKATAILLPHLPTCMLMVHLPG